jgi:hypothetical protein
VQASVTMPAMPSPSPSRAPGVLHVSAVCTICIAYVCSLDAQAQARSHAPHPARCRVAARWAQSVATACRRRWRHHCRRRASRRARWDAGEAPPRRLERWAALRLAAPIVVSVYDCVRKMMLCWLSRVSFAQARLASPTARLHRSHVRAVRALLVSRQLARQSSNNALSRGGGDSGREMPVTPARTVSVRSYAITLRRHTRMHSRQAAHCQRPQRARHLDRLAPCAGRR